ncbi:hypothetical protein DM01DRAFT_1336937 [Hesseltinella vesiculosa]|uniref:Uncharacterized protein n=1 Tax=Hesseltinella vesiculosa TaxID=101127 RepID=A0A1X2GEI3_9FUNG|nr:hypothetical protein DM01DRAFT_1336937 [Hesseltinella vesiculosa]
MASDSVGLITGLTVGLVVGIPLAAFLGYWLYRRSQRSAEQTGPDDEEREVTTTTTVSSSRPPTPPPKDQQVFLQNIPEEGIVHSSSDSSHRTSPYLENALHIPPLMGKASIQRSLTMGSRPAHAQSHARPGPPVPPKTGIRPLLRSASVKVSSRYDNLDLDRYDDDLDHVRIGRAVSIKRSAASVGRPRTPPPSGTAAGSCDNGSPVTLRRSRSGSPVMYAKPSVARVRSITRKDTTPRPSVELADASSSANTAAPAMSPSSSTSSAKSSTPQEGEITVILDS